MIVPEGWKRGSTPINVFRVNVDLTGATVYVTYAQAGVVKIEKTGTDLTITEDTVSTTLTQEDTLKLASNQLVEMQIRYVKSDGTADGSNIVTASVGKILKDGLIEYV